MSKIKSGIIGCGRIGCGFDDKPNQKIIRTHALAYFKNPSAKLVSLCDIDTKKLKKYGRKYFVKNLYTNSKKMFQSEKLDCISICTLVGTHLNLVDEAIKNKIRGIIIEKPISDSLENANKIIQLCKKNNVVLAINHQRRFDPFYQKLADISQGKKLGNIQHVNVIYGGGIANSGPHIFDLLRLLFGEVTSLNGKFSKNKSNTPNDPNIDLHIEFKNNISCSMFAINSKNFGITEIDIIGTKKRLIIDLVSNKGRLFTKSKKLQDYNSLKLSKKAIKSSRPATDIRLGIQNLINCVKTKKTPLCSGYDGYKSLELVITSNLSAKQGKKIMLPIKNKHYKIKSR